MAGRWSGSVKQVVRQKRGKQPSFYKDVMWPSKCCEKHKRGEAVSVPGSWDTMPTACMVPCKISGVFQEMKSKIFQVIRHFKSFQVYDTDFGVCIDEEGTLQNSEMTRK